MKAFLIDSSIPQCFLAKHCFYIFKMLYIYIMCSNEDKILMIFTEES